MMNSQHNMPPRRADQTADPAAEAAASPEAATAPIVESDRETGRPASRGRPAAARVSMREEFLALFRDTRLAPPRMEPSTAREAPAPLRTPTLSAPGPSRFLRRFLQQAAPAPEFAPSGLAGLDLCLGGGLSFGLHLVLGPPASGKTAFLESLAWEAVADRRPALYYALKTGSLRVWERLIITLGTILDGPGIAPIALRDHRLVPTDVETLGRLDAALQTSVLPYLSLIDASPTSTGYLSAFLEDLRSRAREAHEQRGRLPLVLVDDLEALVALTGSRSPLQLLSRLDDALAGESIPGLLAGSTDDVQATPLEMVPVRTVLTLTPTGSSAPPGSAPPAESPMPAGPSAPVALEWVELEVRKNRATGWTGSLSLLLDPSSGLLAECGVDPLCAAGHSDAEG